MILRGVKSTGQTTSYGVWSVSNSASGSTTGGFQQSFARQLNEEYRERIAALFDEINEQAAACFENIDLLNFERYRRLIKELVGEVVNKAFSVNRECILDGAGKQRVYSTVNVIDEKLEQLAGDLLNKNVEQLDFISRIDEIRGLVMDVLL